MYIAMGKKLNFSLLLCYEHVTVKYICTDLMLSCRPYIKRAATVGEKEGTVH